MSSRRERKAQEAEGRALTEQGIKPPGHRNAPMSPVAEVDSAQASRVQSPEARTASPLASPLRDEKKLARLRRRGQIDEFKKELVEEVCAARFPHTRVNGAPGPRPGPPGLQRGPRRLVTLATLLSRRCSSRAATLQT